MSTSVAVRAALESAWFWASVIAEAAQVWWAEVRDAWDYGGWPA